jgi:acyl-CoA thioesterase I
MKVIKIILASAVIGTVGFLTWNYFSQSDVVVTQKPITTIVAYGDSLVKGVGSTEGNDFVSKVSEKMGKPIINLGVPGETTLQGLARIDTVFEQNPDMVILLLGGNDVLQRIDSATTFANIRSIIMQLQEKGIVVVLLGIQGGAIGDPYKKEFEKLAKEFKLTYVSNVLDGLFANRTYMADSVHPNDAGYAKIAERVYAAIKPRISTR